MQCQGLIHRHAACLTRQVIISFFSCLRTADRGMHPPLHGQSGI